MFLAKLTVILSGLWAVLYLLRAQRTRSEAERWRHLRFTRALQANVSLHCPVFRRDARSFATARRA